MSARPPRSYTSFNYNNYYILCLFFDIFLLSLSNVATLKISNDTFVSNLMFFFFFFSVNETVSKRFTKTYVEFRDVYFSLFLKSKDFLWN